MINEEEILSKLEKKVKNLEKLYKKYRSSYFILLEKFEKLKYKKELEDKKLKEILEELDFLLAKIERKFDKLDEIERKVYRLEKGLEKLKVRVEGLEKRYIKMNKKI
jgi:chromosome segregation ATPase